MAVMNTALHLDTNSTFTADTLGDLSVWGDTRTITIKSETGLQQITLYLTLDLVAQLHAELGTYLATAEKVEPATA